MQPSAKWIEGRRKARIMGAGRRAATAREFYDVRRVIPAQKR
jgi:hypothetical protein